MDGIVGELVEKAGMEGGIGGELVKGLTDLVKFITEEGGVEAFE